MGGSGFGTFSPSQAPHFRAPTSDPPPQTPTSDPPPQTPRFSCETTISGPDYVACHVFRVTLQYQAPNMTPTISDPTLFVRDYNIRYPTSLLALTSFIMYK